MSSTMFAQVRRLAELVCVSLCLTGVRGDANSVKLENNSYSGIVIAINPDIPEDSKLIEAIQVPATFFSSTLCSGCIFLFVVCSKSRLNKRLFSAEPMD